MDQIIKLKRKADEYYECEIIPKKSKMPDQPTNADLANLITGVKKDLTEKQDALSTQFFEWKNTVDQRIAVVEIDSKISLSNASKAIDSVDRLYKACDLRIVGVPYSDNEKLIEVFSKIAVLVKYDLSKPLAIPVLFRLKLKAGVSASRLTQHPTIIAKFSVQQYKNAFFRHI